MIEKLNTIVIIWGNDNYNVLGLLRQLTPYVEKVIFLANKNKKGCASKSFFCKHLKVVKSQEEAIEYITIIGKGLKQKGFIITTSDLLAECIDQHSKELSKYFYLSSTAEQGQLTTALNKNYQYKLAHCLGFNVPESKQFCWDSTIEEIIYPILIKPAFKKPDLHHPFKTYVCKNKVELIEVQQHLDKNGTYVLQHFIEKEYDLLVYGCRLEDGRTIYAGSFSKYRWSKGDGSYGTINASIPDCVNLKKLDAFLMKIDYCGLFSAEFGVKDGTAWFYEFNLRNDGTSHYFYQAGLINIPLLWVKSHFEGISSISQPNKIATFIDEIDDKNNIRTGIVTSSEWREQRYRATVFKYYDPQDKCPYYHTKIITVLKNIYHTLKGR